LSDVHTDVVNDESPSVSNNSCTFTFPDNEEISLISNDDEQIEGSKLSNGNVDTVGVDITKEQLIAFQQSDPSLESVRCKVRKVVPTKETGFFLKDGIVHRRYFSPTIQPYVDQLVVPRVCRSKLLELAHDIPLSGHLGQDKTRNRLLSHYFWPRIYFDVKQYCTTCSQCQLTSMKFKSDRAKLIPIPVIGQPFRKIGIG